MPVLSLSASAFVDIAKANAEAFRPFVVPGWKAEVLENADGAPSPFEDLSCRCGMPLVRAAQFWLHGRLWRYDFCFECQEGFWDGKLRSVAASPQLPEGDPVWGMTLVRGKEGLFLPEVGTEQWEKAMRQSGLEGCFDEMDEDDFWQALAAQLGCTNLHEGYQKRSHFGGTASWVQFESQFNCPCCKKPMPLLAQIDEDGGFAWGDCGEAYLFACLEHPEQTACDAQMA